MPLVFSSLGVAPCSSSILNLAGQRCAPLDQNIEGRGRLNVTKDSSHVFGVGTKFTRDDENKRIIIRGKTYVIKEYISPTEIRLTEPYLDATETDVGYSLGPKLVGEPWEVKLPTDLVIIDQNNNLAAINAALLNSRSTG